MEEGGTRDRILGVVDDGEVRREVTLLDATYIHRRKYRPNAFLLGGHFEDDEATGFESVVVGAGRDHGSFGAKDRRATFDLELNAILTFGMVAQRQGLRGRGKFRPKPVCLELGAPGCACNLWRRH